MDKLREEFEAWAERVMPYEVKSEDDRYTSNAVSWAFVAYQAASASRMEKPPFDTDYVWGYLSQVLRDAVGETKDPEIRALMAWLEPKERE